MLKNFVKGICWVLVLFYYLVLVFGVLEKIVFFFRVCIKGVIVLGIIVICLLGVKL